MYMSVERNISHEAGEVKEELCQEAKSRRHLLQNQIIPKRDIVLAIFPADSEMRSVWHECLN